MAKSYYRVINGVRYDRGLLETAESLVEEAATVGFLLRTLQNYGIA